MVSRVPLLGIVVAVALLLGENLGANAYVAAKQHAAEHRAARHAAEDRAALDRQNARLRALVEEARRIDALIRGEGPPSPSAQREVERARRQLEALQVERDRLQVDRR